MTSFNAVALTVLEISAFKVRKPEYSFKENFPLMKFQKVGTKSLISEFSELVFEWLFCNISWIGWPKSIIDPIMESKFQAANVEIVQI